VMDIPNISDARVTIKSSRNGHTVEESPMPVQNTLHLKGRPRVLVQDHGGRPSSAPSFAVPRLLPVEGLRAYLALWVLGCHVLCYRAICRMYAKTCPS